MSAEPASTVAALARREDEQSGALVRLAAPMADIVEAFRDYQALTEKLLTTADYQRISGKRFRKKSAWRKLAVAFGVTFEIRDRVIERDEAGHVQWAEFIVRAEAPNGRFADGWGLCSIRERGFSKPDHDIPATAETRAKNRAASDLFGMGEVSAEEVQASAGTAGGGTGGKVESQRLVSVPVPAEQPPAGPQEEAPPATPLEDSGESAGSFSEAGEVAARTRGGGEPSPAPELTGPATAEQWERAVGIYGSRVKVLNALRRDFGRNIEAEQVTAQHMYDLILAGLGG